MNEKNESTSLLPEGFKRPVWLIWVMLLPQSLLMFLNIRGWLLVRGEMTEAQLRLVTMAFSLEAALILLGVGIFSVLSLTRRLVGPRLCGFIFVVHLGYLWLATQWMGRILPNSVNLWILPGSELLYYQYALIMPALFYAGVRLAAFPRFTSQGRDIGYSFGVLVGVPVFWFSVGQLGHRLFRFWDLPSFISFIFLVGSTTIVLMAFLRLLIYLHRVLGHGSGVLTFLAGIAAPIGGLLLNRKIPFPFDFQSLWVYGFTIANGLILLLPFHKGTMRGVWLLRSVSYTFTLYFFVVFLPYLPLSMLAMIAMGAGFLILAPTLLFIIHTQLLVEEGRTLIQQYGRYKVILSFLACVSVLPAAYTSMALWDKHALVEAIDAVYSPDFETGRVRVDRVSAKRSLERLSEMKEGIYVPFLTDYYNAIVFGGMVLPDHKMQEMHRVLFNEEMDIPKPDNAFGSFFTGAGRSGRATVRGIRPPERKVAVKSIDVEEQLEGEMARTRVRFALQNQGGAGSEFRTEFAVPEGVLITDYALDIGGTNVPGQIFEKKAAMWVYHMIRDVVRRDPGLVVYKKNDTLSFSVFPFASGEVRYSEMEFMYPATLKPEIRIGDQTIVLAESERAAGSPIVEMNDGSGTWLVVPPAQSTTLPNTQRKPYLHLILDCSAGVGDAFDTTLSGALAVAGQMTNLPDCMVTLANYESVDLTSQPEPSSTLASLLVGARGKLPFQGALCPDRAIKTALLRNGPGRFKDESGLPRVPIFVVIRGTDGTNAISTADLSSFAANVVDVQGIYERRPNGELVQYTFSGVDNGMVPSIMSSDPALVFRKGSATAVCRADRGGVVCLDEAGVQPLEIYDPNEGTFVAVTNVVVLPSDQTYARGLSLWEAYRNTERHPASLDSVVGDIVEQSRDTGVLVPLTAYIVVENSAQWEILKRKEKQALANNQALAFDEFKESPEPSIWLLVPVLVLLLVIAPRFARFRHAA